jgi:hypothetical protein
MAPLKKNDLIWSILERKLKPEEWAKITMTKAETPRRRSRSNPRS